MKEDEAPESSPQVESPAVETPIVPELAPAPVPSSNGTHSYFKKVFASMPFFVDRKPIQFEVLDKNTGVLKISTSDPVTPILIATAKARRGGVVQITESEMEELKKKLPFRSLAPRYSPPKLRVLQTELPRKLQESAQSAAVDRNSVTVSGRANGVGSVGGRGTGAVAGTSAPVPVPPAQSPGEFKPTVEKKNFKMPILKKTSSRSFEGGVEEIEPA